MHASDAICLLSNIDEQVPQNGLRAASAASGNTFKDVMCSATYSNTLDYAWQQQDEPIQAANIKGLVLSDNMLIVDAACNNSQANYASPVYLVNVTNLSGQQPTVVTTQSSTTTVSTFQVLQRQFVYPKPEALAPEAAMGVFPSMAPEPADSVSYGGTD